MSEAALKERRSDQDTKISVLYLVHDVHDAAVKRRVEMLEWGGARVVVAGFRRRDETLTHVRGAPVIDLGRTHDAKLAARAASVARVIMLELGWIDEAAKDHGGPDIVMARNLEMLLIGEALRRRRLSSSRLIYECLDIHRAMLGHSWTARRLRAIERQLLRRCSLLLVSSTAFIKQYFEPLQGVKGDWRLIENKVLATNWRSAPVRRLPDAPPWRIGWFGILRCQRSLDLLCELAAGGQFDVVLRGRPALNEFRDFKRQVNTSNGVSFHGPYGASDLGEHYGEIHFAWAVDYFDAGANSDWLLPNRLYEAGAYGVPVIARRGSELARVVETLGCGFDIEPEEENWAIQLELACGGYGRLRVHTEAQSARFVMREQECLELVEGVRLATFS